MAGNRSSQSALADRPAELKKVMPQDGLRAFVEESLGGTRRVLIEPEVVQPYLVARPSNTRKATRRRFARPVAVHALSARDRQQVAARLAKVRERLRAVGAKRTVTLLAAQAVTAQLTAEQLLRLAAYPEVRRIVLNEHGSAWKPKALDPLR